MLNFIELKRVHISYKLVSFFCEALIKGFHIWLKNIIKLIHKLELILLQKKLTLIYSAIFGWNFRVGYQLMPQLGPR